MSTFIRFLFEFMSVFFSGIGMMFSGLFKGFIQLFNISEYAYIVEFYRSEFNIGEWILVVIAIIILIILLGLIILLIWFIVSNFIKINKKAIDQ